MIATMCWVIIIFLLEMAGQGIVPRSVPFIYFLVGTLLIGGMRFAAKWVLNAGTACVETKNQSSYTEPEPRRRDWRMH